jgi:hypothetical protein
MMIRTRNIARAFESRCCSKVVKMKAGWFPNIIAVLNLRLSDALVYAGE